MKNKKQGILSSLNKLIHPYLVNNTEYSGHEVELVKQGISIGYRKFISVGGDGTLHHVVNGIMKYGEESSSHIKVGVIPIGTGNDWIKQYSIPKDVNRCVSILNQEKTVVQDIGRICSSDKDYYFNNLAGIGFDGYVVKKIEAFRKYGKSAYFLASLSGLLTYKKQTVTYKSSIKSDSVNIYLLAIGLCRYCGSGMQLTHNPNPKDGLFDITVVKDISAFGFVWNIRKMFNQKLHLHPKVDTFKCAEISVSSQENSSVLMQADGELIPFDSATVSVIPRAIQVVIPE